MDLVGRHGGDEEHRSFRDERLHAAAEDGEGRVGASSGQDGQKHEQRRHKQASRRCQGAHWAASHWKSIVAVALAGTPTLFATCTVTVKVCASLAVHWLPLLAGMVS